MDSLVHRPVLELGMIMRERIWGSWQSVVPLDFTSADRSSLAVGGSLISRQLVTVTACYLLHGLDRLRLAVSCTKRS